MIVLFEAFAFTRVHKFLRLGHASKDSPKDSPLHGILCGGVSELNLFLSVVVDDVRDDITR